MKTNAFAQQFNVLLPLKETMLYCQDLLAHGTKDTFFQTIEFVEASPCAHLAKPAKNSAHGAEVEGFVTILNSFDCAC